MAYDTSQRSRAAALAVVFVYLAPIVYAVSRRSHDAIYNFFAADAYYYLTIAKRTQPFALPTFDGVSPTNGFHPLWQYLLVGLSSVANGDKTMLVSVAFAVDCAIASAGIYVLARTIYEEQRHALLPLLLVPNVFHVLAAGSGLYSLSSWRLVNGMETALSLLLLAVLIRKLAAIEHARGGKPWTDGDFLAIGCTAALLVWSRLDNFALVAALPLLLVCGSRSARSAACLLAPPLAALVVYIAANIAFGLPPLPVSGVSKTGIVLRGNATVILDTLAAPFGGWLEMPMPSGWRLRSRLMSALLTGILLSLSLAAASMRTRASGTGMRRRNLIYFPLVVFFLIRLFYYIAFIRLSGQGFWYYVDIAVALTAVILLQIDVARFRTVAWNAVVGVAWLVVYTRSVQQLLDFTFSHEWCPHVLSRDAERITRCLERREREPKIIDSSDGIFAYFLDVPAQPGTGLTATAANYRFIAKHGLASYHRSLISQGYGVNTVSPLCDSGHVSPRVVERDIDCGQHRALRLNQLVRLSTAPEENARPR